MNKDPDVQNMIRFKEGDEDGFRILYKKYKKKIINYCYRFCCSREIAEELAQEVFIRVYKAAPRYRHKAKFSTWIFRIATNVCLNEIRQSAKKRKLTDSMDAPIESEKGKMHREVADIRPQAQDIIESKERDKLVMETMAKLKKKQRAALILRINNGFSYKEIAGLLKTSENGVKTLIHRGRKNMADYLEKISKEAK